MKTALVTGASGGIGSEILKIFVQNGYTVIAQYNKNKNDLDLTIKELESQGYSNKVVTVFCDFNDQTAIADFSKFILEYKGGIDVLINNAGTELFKLIDQTTDAEIQKLLAVNLNSAFVTVKSVANSMISKKKGKIVNVSSIWGVVGSSMESVYSATKSALIGYTKALAKELGPSGINVNCVCPGVIDTKMNACLSKEDMLAIVGQTPLGRIGKPIEVAELIYFLCSNKADFITGEVITIDGGFIL